MRPAQLLAAVFALSSLSAAWPWPENIDYKGVGDFILIGRQNNDNNNNGGDNSNKDNKNGGDNSNNNNNDNSDKPSPQSSKSSAPKTDSSKTTDPPKSSKGSKSDDNDSSKTSSKTYGIGVQPARISLMTPAMTSGPQYFAIGDYVTFGWNYTDLKGTPNAVDVLASCSDNSHMYTIANKIPPGKSGFAVWDSSKYANDVSPLPMASYTLYIKDHADSISATPKPGYLMPFNQYQFVMYSPKPYTPFSDWNCATCLVNAGIANVPAHHTLTMVIGMGMLTVLSFTWFASNRFGVF